MRIMITTGGTVGLAEGIIDSTQNVFIYVTATFTVTIMIDIARTFFPDLRKRSA